MSRRIIGSRAELVAALRKQRPTPERAERVRALLQDMFLDALFLVAQFPGGQIAEAEKCCYAYDVRACAGLCRATWAEEAFWSGLVRVSHPGPKQRTRLMHAAVHGDALRVAWLLARGAPREAKDVKGWTALHRASWKGFVAVVRVLLAAGTNVNAALDDGATPLYIAAEFNRIDAVRALLAAGANADAAMHVGCTPLYIAARHGHVDAVRVLIAAGANVDATLNNGGRSLHTASSKNHAAAATVLLDAGAAVNALDNRGRSPLACAKTPAMRALLAARGGV